MLEQPDRRTVLKGIGGSLVGSAVMSGAASAHDDDEPPHDIELRYDEEAGTHVFDPPSWEVESFPDGVVWLHDDHDPGGIVHNVRIHEHDDPTTQLNSPRLAHGDTYTVEFSHSGSTLTLSDGRKTVTIDTEGRDEVDLGVHCDYHLGQTDLEGSMKMDSFVVKV